MFLSIREVSISAVDPSSLRLLQFYFIFALIGGLYYKHIMIINYDSSVNKFGASLTDDASHHYDHHGSLV
jgi:hypothetical protein